MNKQKHNFKPGQLVCFRPESFSERNGKFGLVLGASSLSQLRVFVLPPQGGKIINVLHFSHLETLDQHEGT